MWDSGRQNMLHSIADTRTHPCTHKPGSTTATSLPVVGLHGNALQRTSGLAIGSSLSRIISLATQQWLSCTKIA